MVLYYSVTQLTCYNYERIIDVDVVSQLLKTRQLQGGFASDPRPGALPQDPTGGIAPRLHIEALQMGVAIYCGTVAAIVVHKHYAAGAVQHS